MRYQDLAVEGALVMVPEPHADERGSFARIYDETELTERGFHGGVVQMSLSHNLMAGTLRGLHWQAPPHADGKLVRCTRGRVFDVVVDVRPGSPTYGRWDGVEIGADRGWTVVVPPGVAHGFLTLEDDSEMLYAMTASHRSGAERGLRWDDPTVAVAWPATPSVLSSRDRSLPGWPPEG